MTDGPKPSGARGTWWVDERGNWRLVDPASNRGHISRPFGPGLAQEGAGYRAIGCVKVTIGDDFTCINWDVCEVEPGAIQAVLDFLRRDRGTREFILNYFYAGWNSECWANAPEALRRIEYTTAYREVELIDTLLMERRDLAEVMAAKPEIRRAFECWQRTSGRFDERSDSELAQLSRQVLTFALSPHEDELVFKHTGQDSSYAQVYGTDSAQSQIGLPSDYNGPDQGFADRVCLSYAAVLAQEEPQYDHVRALIHRDIGEPLWAPYQRLLLPCKQSDGSPLLVCLTTVTQDISIPFLEARMTQSSGISNILRLGV